MLQLEKLIGKNYFLNQSAKEAFKAYVRAYDSHHLKLIFDVATLDLAKVAKSFGFTVPPAVDLRILSKHRTTIYNMEFLRLMYDVFTLQYFAYWNINGHSL